MVVLKKIGESKFSCVFKPDLFGGDNNKITKLFFEEEDYNNELYNYLHLIKPNDIYNVFVSHIETAYIIDNDLKERIREESSKFDSNVNIAAMNMEYLGMNIHELSIEGPTLKLADVWDELNILGKGIDYLHKNSIIHGDIKPANVLWKNNRFCLIDYGMSHKYINNLSNVDVCTMAITYAFFPTEYSLIAYVYRLMYDKKILKEPFNDINKGLFFDELNRNDENLVDVLLKNREEAHIPILLEDDELIRANTYIKEFRDWFIEFEINDDLRIVDVLYIYFKDLQHLVDVYGFGSMLYKLTLCINRNQRPVLYQLCRSFTHINPIQRHIRFSEYLHK